MDKWKSDIIDSKIEQLNHDEKRQFMVAYANLDDELHNYLTEYPQGNVVWFAALSDEEVGELRKTYPNKIRYRKDNKRLYYSTVIPFLSLSGCIVAFNKDYKGASVKTNIEAINGKYKVTTGVKAMNADGNEVSYDGVAIANKIEDIENATSNSFRKALTFMGYGRLGKDTTKYREDEHVIQFKKWLKNENTNPK